MIPKGPNSNWGHPRWYQWGVTDSGKKVLERDGGEYIEYAVQRHYLAAGKALKL